jgi:hypothetical protein
LKNAGHFISDINYTLDDVHVNKVLRYKPFCLKGLEYIAQIYNWYGNCSASQRVIARHMGTCRKTANEQIKILREDGVLDVAGRFFDTSLYSPGQLLTDIKYRERLKHVIPQLKFFPMFKLFQTRFGYTNISRDTKRETLRVATGYYPYATVAQGAKSKVNPQMEHIGESMSVVESYIAPYVHEITDIPLSFGDKYQLSQWSQRIVATALRVMRAKEKNPRTFAYLSGICRHVAGKTSGKTNDFTKSKPAKYRFENDPVTLDSHVIDLEEERMEKEQMAFLMGREYIANSTSGSELLDYNVKRMLAIQADKKAAEEEVIRLTNDGIAIGDFIKEIRELNQWNPKADIEDIEWMIAEYEYTNSLQNTRVTENNTEGAVAHEVSH